MPLYVLPGIPGSVSTATSAGFAQSATSAGFATSAALASLASNVIFRGVLVTQSVGVSLTPSTANVVLSWSSAIFDATNGVGWSTGQPSRLAVGANISVVQLCGNVLYDFDAAGWRRSQMFKNSVAFAGQPFVTTYVTSAVGVAHNLATGPLQVSQGDFFEVLMRAGAAASSPSAAGGNGTWFGMIVLG